MRRLPLVLALLGFAALVPGLSVSGGVARAQDRDVQPLMDRLDRLERDMNMMQRQVYQGAYQNSRNGGPVVVTPPDSQAALSNEVQVSQLQEQMRALTGQIEQINYGLTQLKNRLDRLSSDVDQRFAQVGGGAGSPPPGPSAMNNPPPPDGMPPGPPPPGAGANPSMPASRSGTLGTLSGNNPPPGPPPGAPGPTPAAAGSAGVLPSGSPMEQYNYAFGLLRRADYPAAEQALKAFVQRFPNDQLAGNAQYWLGETYYVRKDYANAATAFAEGYQRYPKGSKAPDDLLKLGMTLGNLGQKADACRALARLDRDFPGAPANIKERQASSKQQFGC